LADFMIAYSTIPGTDWNWCLNKYGY
jgi:hypothetical protein